MRTKYVCFTCNNYRDEHVIRISTLVKDGLATYVIIGFEVGANGTRHIQGYAEFPNRLRLNQLRELLPNCHIESRRGTSEEARTYCQKDGNFQEFGELRMVRQGQRSDLQSLHQSLQMGANRRTISQEHFACFLRYSRGIDRYLLHNACLHRAVKSVIVYWGTTGSGKTSAVWDNLASPEDIWVYSGSGWFDGYDRHPIALFDDFNGGEFKLTFLLRVLDEYPMRVPVKGGFVNWCPTEVYITSNLSIDEWFPNAAPEHVKALKRRITFKYNLI